MPMTSSENPISVLCIIGSCISLQVGAALAIHLFNDGGTWGTTAVRLLVAGTILLLFSRPRIREWDRRSTRRVEPGQFHRNTGYHGGDCGIRAANHFDGQRAGRCQP